MPEVQFSPLELAAPQAPVVPELPPVPSWREVTADPRWEKASTAKRQEVLDKWVVELNAKRAEVPDFDPAAVYDFAQRKRAEIRQQAGVGEQAWDVVKALPGAVVDMVAGAGVAAWEQLPKVTGNYQVPTPVADRMVEKTGKIIEGAATNNALETARLRDMQQEFTDALGREQLPTDPAAMREWVAGWNTKLVAQARKAYPATTIITGDAVSMGRRSMTDNEENLADMSGFLQTKNPQYMERVFNRVTSPDATAQADEKWEKALKPLPEWRKRAMEVGSDPVNLLAMAGSVGVGAMAAAPLRAGASKAAQLAARGGAVVADAELNAQAAKLSAWTQNQNASEGELDDAARMGRFAAYMFAGLGAAGSRVMKGKGKGIADSQSTIANESGKAADSQSTIANESGKADAGELRPEGEINNGQDIQVQSAGEGQSQVQVPVRSVPVGKPGIADVGADAGAAGGFATAAAEAEGAVNAPTVRVDSAADLAAAIEPMQSGAEIPQAMPRGRAAEQLPRTLEPVPESPATVAVQAERLASGRKPAMLVTKGEVMPEMPRGFESVEVAEGTVIFDPETFDAAGIREAADNNQLGEVLGYGVGAKSAAADRSVVLRDAEGTEVAAVFATADEVPQVAAALDAQSVPTDTITVEHPMSIIEERVANTPADPEVAGPVRRPPAPGIPVLPDNARDIWNFLDENKIAIPRRRAGVKRGGELDANLPQGVPPRYMKVFSQEGRPAVDVAQAAYDNMEEGVHKPLIDAPTTEALKARMDADMAARKSMKDEIARVEREASAFDRFYNATRARKSGLPVDPATLQAGDTMRVGKDVYEVNQVRPDWISVSKVGARGEFKLRNGEVLHVDTVERQSKAPPVKADRTKGAQAARFEQETRMDAGGKLPVPAAALQVGDVVTIDGTPVKVVEVVVDDFTELADVVVEDGRRFGRQVLPDGKIIYAERVKRSKDAPPVSGNRQMSAELSLQEESARTGKPVPPAVARLSGMEVKQADVKPEFSLEAVDDATLHAEAGAAAAKQKIAEGQARRLSGKEIDTTGDLLDSTAGENALFAFRRPELPEPAAKVAAVAQEFAGDSLGPGASAAAEWRPHKATARMANDQRLSGRTRELFTEGQDYRVVSRAENLEEVRMIIEQAGGLRQAIDAIDSPELEPRLKVALADLAIRKLDTERAMAKSADEINALDDVIDEVARKLNRINLEAGRAVEANKHISLLTPESILSELAERVEERVEQGRHSPLGKALEEQKADAKPKLEATEKEIIQSTNEAAAATAAEIESLRRQLEEARRNLAAMQENAPKQIPDDVASGPDDATLIGELNDATAKVADLEATAAKTEAGSVELISLLEQIRMAKEALAQTQREVIAWERARGKQLDVAAPRDSQLTLGIKDYPIKSKEAVIQAQLARLDHQFAKMKEALGWTPDELARNEAARQAEAAKTRAEKMANMDDRVGYMRQTVASMRAEVERRRRAILPKADAEAARIAKIEREIAELNNMASLTDEQLVIEQARRSAERKAKLAAAEGKMSETMRQLREVRAKLREQIDDRTTLQGRRERLLAEEAELQRLLAEGTADEIEAYLNPTRRPRAVEPVDIVTARKRIRDLRREADDLQTKMLGMPAELQTKVRELTHKIRQAPAGVFQADLHRQLLAEVAMWEGVDLLALGEEYWMANLLSGINTQGVNVWGNGLNLFLRTMIAGMREGNLQVNADMLAGMGRGAREGARDFVRSWQGKDVVKWQEKYGLRESNLDKVADMFRGKTGPLARTAQAIALGRYVFRALQGMDAFFWRTAYEGRVSMSMSRWAKSEAARRGVTHAQFMADELHNSTAETAAAMAQATKEAADLDVRATARDIEARAWEILDMKRPENIRADARRFADLATYTNTPEGSMGVVAQLANRGVEMFSIPTRFGDLRVLKPIVPFVNTLANVTSAGMDFTPVGIWRGLHGKHIVGDGKNAFTAVEARERLIAGVLGTTVAGLLYGLAGSGGTKEDPYFEVVGEGPPDADKKRQWRNAGAIPFSVKVGNSYWSYKESPLGLVLSVIGGLRDMEKYSKQFNEQDAMARAWYVLGVAPQAMSQQGMMQGVESLSGLLSGQPGKLKRLAEGIGKGFVPADGMLRDVGRLFDPTVVDSKSLAGAILKDVPVIRRSMNEPALNIMGDAVRTEGLARLPIISRIASSQKTSDREVDFLASNGLWVPGFGKTINVGQGLRTKGEMAFADKVAESRVAKLGRMHAGILTDDETRLYIRTQGTIFRHGIKLMMARHANGQGAKDQAGMQREVDNIAEIARKAAMRDMLGLPQQAPRTRR